MLLLWLILISFFGGFLCWQSEKINVKIPCWIALITTSFIFILSLKLWLQHNYYTPILSTTFSQRELEIIFPWVPRFGITVHLAIDGLSLLMIILTGFLGTLAVLCSWKEIKHYCGLFYLNLMFVLGSAIGVFLSMDMFLFFIFWEMMITPMYFLIALWGFKEPDNKKRIMAATKFFIYTQASSLLMLTAILSLVFIHYDITNVWTFDYEKLLNTHMSRNVEYLLMLSFFVAFATKLPIVPLHSWLPDAHCQAPTAGSVDISGILLKTAAYGLLRFSLPLFPKTSHEFAPIAMWLGVFSIFYGAWMAFIQYDVKRLVSYSSIAHMGLMIIAIYTNNQLAYQGVIMQLVANSLSTAGLFILCGQLYERLHTRNMHMMGGLWNKIKFLPALSVFFVIATLSIPGTGNFIGEFMILFGNFEVSPVITIFSTCSLLWTTVYSLAILHRIYFGKETHNITATSLAEMSFRELLIMFLLVVPLILFGFYPKPILNITHVV